MTKTKKKQPIAKLDLWTKSEARLVITNPDKKKPLYVDFNLHFIESET